jgi:hypothetical protein
VQLKHAILLLRMLHQHDWLSIVKVYVTDFPVVDELSSPRIWKHKLCATFSANVNINYRLPIKLYYRICTVRHIRILIHGSQNVFKVLTWVARILVDFIPRSRSNIRQLMLKLKVHSCFHELFLKYNIQKYTCINKQQHPTKHRGWTYLLRKGKQFLLH